jgi:hypothetical protein
VASVADTVGVAASVVVVGGAALAAWRYLSDVYAKTLGSRRRLAAKLLQIGPGVTIEHVRALLGTPVYTRTPEGKPPDKPGVLWSSLESIFFTRHAYVQIIHNPQGEVLGLGVTTIDPDFTFSLRQLPPILAGKKLVRIARTRFGEIPRQHILGWWLHRGPYSSFYWELLAFGRAGGPLSRYMTFAIARNKSGIGSYGDPHVVELTGLPPTARSRPDAPGLDQFRKNTTINTVCVYSAKVVVDDLAPARNPWGIGIDSEGTPDLLELYRGPIRRLRDAIHGARFRLQAGRSRPL